MLYIMRHGKTDWNVRHKFQGRTNIPLNEEGRLSARLAGEEYRNLHLNVCFSSPLIRARETAEIFLRGGDVPIITDERLCEMSFGIYEGTEDSFSIPDCPVNVLFHHPERYIAVENGESITELMSRTGEFIDRVITPRLERGEDILIVGHGAMNSSIICRMRNKPISEFWSEGIENCKLIRLV